MSRAAILASAVFVCLAAPSYGFTQSLTTIRVYDSTATRSNDRTKAIREAAAIFSDAGLNISWRDCSRNGADFPCAGPRQPQDLVVRILERSATPDTPASNAVTAAVSATSVQIERLGFAAVTAPSGGGVIATVYAEHIGRVITRTGIPFDLLLGRAIAHEVGHLFSGAHGHTTAGLMRAVWTDDELRRNRGEDWHYLAEAARTTRSRGNVVEGSSGVAPGTAPFD